MEQLPPTQVLIGLASLCTAQVPDNANEGPGHCLDIDGMLGTSGDTATTTSKIKT